MTQEQFNLIVRAMIFSSSTDCCMGEDDMNNAVDILRELVIDNPELLEALDLGEIYIYGNDPENQEDAEINKKLFKIFGYKLEQHE